MIGSRSRDHALSDVVATIQADTLNMVVGGTYVYDEEYQDRSVWLYFLDYEACEIMWSWQIFEMNRIVDLLYLEYSYIVAVALDEDDEPYLLVVNNVNPKSLDGDPEFPKYRVHALSETGSEFYKLVGTHS